ncbi:AEC family transporter [Turicibacter sanguinis]|jgi:transporter, auxin efflux carrier (AEC) family protein|uniref:AEC family transporter n=4 Tax=Turicibacter sanguinis TaxID=154288 RepID=A0A9X5ANM4_9FIRM|nr:MULTISPECIES: AEC family transporter [Turicibacter]EFF64354.1 transporter, auxin efflux carrier (AEC) family protein [Turicibacter sanguinis PC909]EGC92768.1 transporter, auxin efflux carrier (AEC) family protein [Turicibacter sp. HGF1]MBP3904713.1 AEC family transporter [Turicibacter sp.]MCU7191724.1 AEC family transporter [Turicibacter sanguinis]MCU7197779.1 AEC family transporter [Turicibacter sanguinis]
MLEIIKSTLSDNAILGAIFSSVSIILLGFYLRKRNMINSTASKMLTKVVLTVSLPALAFTSFMKDINGEQLKQGMSMLVWGFAIYLILIPLTKIMFAKVKGDKQDVYRVLTIFGSTTFFGTPIVTAVYGAVGTMYSNIFNIAYRVFLYSYAFIKMSGTKMDKENFKKNMKEIFLNPIILATFFGLFIWLCQDMLPQVNVTVNGEVKQYAFLRLDQTLPWFYKALDYLKALASPLAWISIGATLAEVPFKDAISQKDAWGYSFIKVLFIPVINLVLLVLVNQFGILPVSFEGMATTVIMMAAPTATVAAAYAINYDREALFTSNCSLLSTVVAVIAMPIWIVVLELIKTLGLF